MEDAPRLRNMIRLTYALVDAWIDSYAKPLRSMTSTTPATSSTVISSFRSSTPMEPVLGLDPRDDRCFRPIHVYETDQSRPVAMVLRPGKTPSGVEVRGHLRRLVRRIRTRWHSTRLLCRGDGHTLTLALLADETKQRQ